MRDIELEEGEAYYLQDDDDENIDPDKDFSYIDKKIENVLGHYQKDFMGGLSAESLGARFGGYGSFLPMQQRSPSILSNQRPQSHISLKSPHNLPSEHFHQNSTVTANHSLPVRPGPASSDHGVQTLSESGISLINNQLKFQNLGECVSDHQHKKSVHDYDQKMLKFRVKVGSDSGLSRDNAELYSGLGLDMSPSSSLEDSPTEFGGTSPGMQEMKGESPSCIVKIMTSFPLCEDALLSPLHDSLVCLMGMDDHLETRLPGCGQVPAVNVIDESNCSEEKREVCTVRKPRSKEASKDRKSKLKDAGKDRKSKHKESNKERKSKQNVPSGKSVELVKDHEYLANAVDLCANRMEENGKSVAKEGVSKTSINSADVHSEEKVLATSAIKTTGSKLSAVFEKKGEVGCLEDDIDKSVKKVQVDRDKVKEEFGSVSCHDAALEDKGTLNTSKGKIEKDKKAISVPRKESSTDKRNVMGCREEEANEFLKQQSFAKDKVKEAVVNSVCPSEAGIYSKENEKREKIPRHKEVGFASGNDFEENKQYDNIQEMKDHNAETLEPSKQRLQSKAIPHSHMGPKLHSGKEHPSSVVRKKSKEGQTDGISAVAQPRGSSIVGSSDAENEEVVGGNTPSKGRRGDVQLDREMRKGSDVAINANLGKKGKEAALKDSVMGVSQRETHSFTSKLKEKSSSKNTGLASNVEDLASANSVMEKAPVGDVPLAVPPAENASVVIEEDWVQCEKCQKWRLLPFGTNPDLLPKKWICSMLNWLPGKNKCSISEDETTNGLRALYLAPLPASQVQPNQQAYPDGSASMSALAGAQHAGLPSRVPHVDSMPSGGKKRNLMISEIDAAKQGGIQEFRNLDKKDQQHSGEVRNSKHLKKQPRELDDVGKNGDGKPSKIEKKRAADFEACGVPKKTKRVREQSMEKPDHGRLLKVEAKSETRKYVAGGLRNSKDIVKGSSDPPLMKAKQGTHNAMIPKDGDEKNNVPGKKRKLKDQRQKVMSTEEPSSKGHHSSNNSVPGKNSGTEHRKEKKEKKSRSLNFQVRQLSSDEGNVKTQSDRGKQNFGGSSARRLQREERIDLPLEQHHVSNASQKTVGVRKSCEKAHDLLLSDNATTSSSSKISYKVKAKGREVKYSPMGSISSSPLRLSESDPNKGANKLPTLHIDSEELFSVKRIKSSTESASSELRDRKSDLPRNSGIGFDAADEDHSVNKAASGRRLSSHRLDTRPKLKDYGDSSGKLDRIYHKEGTSTSQPNFVSENQVAGSLNRLNFVEINPLRGKSHVSQIASENEPSCHSHGGSEFEKFNGSGAIRIVNVNVKPLRQVGDDHASSGHSHPTGNVSKDIEASSSMRKDSFNRAAKTALKEAKDLKHSADRLKISGSESTWMFFQAALKFLQGASLLDPGNSESGRCGEISSTEVYSTTAKLCEYCAHEYERCNDMASAALAYKCMEVAYMRVVCSNDIVASRDRLELQIAVRAAPQVESPSSSASDIDNLNNQAAADTAKDEHSTMDHRNHVISAGNRANFVRLLTFTEDINRAMEASRKSQSAFAAANSVLALAGNEEGISSIKRVLDFSFHDVDGLLHLVRLAMEALHN